MQIDIRISVINFNQRTNCWARAVKELLEACGFCYSQGVGDKRYFLSVFKERLFDIDIQSWRYDVQDTSMGKLRTHKLLKVDLVCESYLNEILVHIGRLWQK